MIAYSRLGNSGTGWIVGGGLVSLLAGVPLRGVALAALVFGTLCVNYVVKRLVHRERPVFADVPPLIEPPQSLSFPSSHAAMAAAAATGFSAYAPSYWLGFATLAVLMAASRVYLAVHHGSDVVAGLALGLVTGGVFAVLVH